MVAIGFYLLPTEGRPLEYHPLHYQHLKVIRVTSLNLAGLAPPKALAANNYRDPANISGDKP